MPYAFQIGDQVELVRGLNQYYPPGKVGVVTERERRNTAEGGSYNRYNVAFLNPERTKWIMEENLRAR